MDTSIKGQFVAFEKLYESVCSSGGAYGQGPQYYCTLTQLSCLYSDMDHIFYLACGNTDKSRSETNTKKEMKRKEKAPVSYLKTSTKHNQQCILWSDSRAMINSSGPDETIPLQALKREPISSSGGHLV